MLCCYNLWISCFCAEADDYQTIQEAPRRKQKQDERLSRIEEKVREAIQNRLINQESAQKSKE